jgi:hypothetical protein
MHISIRLCRAVTPRSLPSVEAIAGPAHSFCMVRRPGPLQVGSGDQPDERVGEPPHFSMDGNALVRDDGLAWKTSRGLVVLHHRPETRVGRGPGCSCHGSALPTPEPPRKHPRCRRCRGGSPLTSRPRASRPLGRRAESLPGQLTRYELLSSGGRSRAADQGVEDRLAAVAEPSSWAKSSLDCRTKNSGGADRGTLRGRSSPALPGMTCSLGPASGLRPSMRRASSPGPTTTARPGRWTPA